MKKQEFIDLFFVDRFGDEEMAFLGYVEQLGLFISPEYASDKKGNVNKTTNLHNIFAERYNDRELSCPPFTPHDVFRHKDICATLQDKCVDQKKFWYLLLFVFDFIENMEYAKSLYNSTYEQVDRFLEHVKLINSIKGDGKIALDSSVEISIKTGRISATVDQDKGASFLLDCIQTGYDQLRGSLNEKIELDDNEEDNGSDEEYNENDYAEEYKAIDGNSVNYNIPRISCVFVFYKLLNYFFDNRRLIRRVGVKREPVIMKKRQFITKMAYVTKLLNGMYELDSMRAYRIVRKHEMKKIRFFNHIYEVLI
jgi:hypothetical protein